MQGPITMHEINLDPLPTREEVRAFVRSLTDQDRDDLKMRVEFMTYQEVEDWRAKAAREKDRPAYLKSLYVCTAKMMKDGVVVAVIGLVEGDR
jgi:hypothetical protein